MARSIIIDVMRSPHIVAISLAQVTWEYHFFCSYACKLKLKESFNRGVLLF